MDIAKISHRGLVKLALVIISIAMAFYHMWAIAFGSSEALLFRGTHLLFALVLVFLLYRVTSKSEDMELAASSAHPADVPKTSLPTLADYVLLVLAATPILYLFVNYDYIVNRIFYIDDLTPMDMIMGVLMTVIVLEATRRVIGWALPITAIVFLIYGLFIARLEPMRMLDQLYMTTEGIFGIPLSVSAGYVLIFVLFGSFMERTGTGQLFMDFAMALTGHTAGGPGKVSVVSSSLFGTISGSAVANVMVDGPISIPLMKRSGFPPHFAARRRGHGVDRRADHAADHGRRRFRDGRVSRGLVRPGGDLGDHSGDPLLRRVLCRRAFRGQAARPGRACRAASCRASARFSACAGHLFIPVVLILVVMYSGYSAPLAALVGTLACFPVAALRKSTRGYVNWPNIMEAFVDGARNALGVAAACACAGIVIGVVTLSGWASCSPSSSPTSPRHAALGAGADHAGRHRARHGHADDAGLHHHDGAPGAGDHQARRHPAAAAYVRVLLRVLSAINAAGRARRVRGRRHRQIRPVGERLGGGEDRRRRLSSCRSW